MVLDQRIDVFSHTRLAFQPAIIVAMPKTKPTVRHSKRVPVTVWYSAHSVIPVREVTYRAVKVLKTGIGANLGLRYGIIRYAGAKRIVVSRNGQQWELLNPIAPLGYK